MVSRKQRFWNGVARYVEKPMLALISNQAFLRSSGRFYTPLAYRCTSDMEFTGTRLGGVPALWCDRGDAGMDAVILYLHGGAYTVGGADTHKQWVAALAGIAGCRGLLVDYRLAPEHPFPAACEDALTAYRALLDKGWRADQIVLAGDSAGGGLALSLLARLPGEGLPNPLCLVTFSPLTDLTLTAPSIQRNQRSEHMLPLAWLKRTGVMYCGDTPADHPMISPLYAEFTNPPPVMIQCGRGEILADDSLRMAEHLRAAGGDVTLRMVEDVAHVWPIHAGQTPEADQANDLAGAFIRKLLNARRMEKET